MKRPSIFVFIAGRPLVAYCLLMVCAASVAGCVFGSLQWWIAVIAAVAALRVSSAVSQLRAYKSWAADWDAMGKLDDGEQPPRRKESSGRWRIVRLISAVILFYAIGPLQQSESLDPSSSGVFTLLRSLLALYLFIAVLLTLVRYLKRKIATDVQELKDKPVSWLLPRASSSPSRMDAQKALPAYTARLLQQVQTQRLRADSGYGVPVQSR